jgi:hypothetical protein
VLLRDDVVADRQAEPGAFAGRLGGEKRLKQFVPDLGRDPAAVVAQLPLGFVLLGSALVELASKVGNDLLRIGQHAVWRQAHFATSSGPSSR